VQLDRARRRDRFLDCRARELVAIAQRLAFGQKQSVEEAGLDVVGRRPEHGGDERQLEASLGTLRSLSSSR